MKLALPEILQLIPHRGEALFLSNAEILSDTEGTGEASWSSKSAILLGHFPGSPVVPGVLQVEALAQLGAVIVKTAGYKVRPGGGGVLAMIRSSRFQHVLGPDRVLSLEASVRAMQHDLYLVRGHGTLQDGSIRVFAAELVLAIASISQEIQP